MARGNQIIVTSDPRGQFDEGIIDDTSMPGTIMEIVPATAMAGRGRFHLRAAATGTDGKAAQQMVLLEDNLQGKTINDAYVAGTGCRVYTPEFGEECNVLVAQGSGTSDTVAIGDKLMLAAAAGTLKASSFASATPWQALEAYTQQTNPQLTWCRRI